MDKNKVRYLHKQNMKNHRKIYDSKDGYKIKCVHEDGCFPILGQIFEDFKPELVLELGFSWGGITKLFEDYTEAEIHAYNRKCSRRPIEKQFGKRVEFHWCNLLSKPYQPLIELCKDSRKKILYCDNGNKILEVAMYGQYLNKGDMVGAHDYPREIYHDYDLLLDNIKNKITRRQVDKMNAVLADFEPAYHDLMLQMGFSDRFWIKVK